MGNLKAFRLDDDLVNDISRFAKMEGVSQSDFIRNAIRREIVVRKFDELHAEMVPKARAMGIYTDEDVFRLLESET